MPIVTEPHFEPGQRIGRWTGNGGSVAPERAAVARTDDSVRIRLPGREAPEVCAHGAQRIETFLGSYHEDAEAGVERDGADCVTLGPAYADDRRRLVEHVRGEIAESEYARAQSGHAQRSCADLYKLAAIESGAVLIAGVLVVVFWHGL